MTQSQQESLYMVYIHICNALAYAELLYMDDLSINARSSIKVIKERLAWLKKAMDMKVSTDVSKEVDYLRYDSVMRLMSSMPEQYQDRLEDTLIKFLREIEKEIL